MPKVKYDPARGLFEEPGEGIYFDTPINASNIVNLPGTPEGVITAPIGTIFLSVDSVPALWIKETLTGSIGWVPAASAFGLVSSVNGRSGSVIVTSTDVGAVPTSALGVAGGVATLDNSGVISSSQLPFSSPLIFRGVWDANLNVPALTSSIGTHGEMYIVAASGSTNLDGIASWNVGDSAIFSSTGSAWQRVGNASLVSSVAGRIGAVTLDADDIAETVNRVWVTTTLRDDIPNSTQKDALIGTSGTPSNINRYVTDNDVRFADGRFTTLSVSGTFNHWTSQSGGWKDITGAAVAPTTGPSVPAWTQIGSSAFYAYKFGLNDQLWFTYHIPHDYSLGTTIYFHSHWTTDGTNAQPVVWEYTHTYAHGFNQANYNIAGTVITASQAAAGTAYRHMVTETVVGASGSGFEPDGIILVRVRRISNAGTDNTDNVFLIENDCHYQSNTIATKNRAPNFYT